MKRCPILVVEIVASNNPGAHRGQALEVPASSVGPTLDDDVNTLTRLQAQRRQRSEDTIFELCFHWSHW